MNEYILTYLNLKGHGIFKYGVVLNPGENDSQNFQNNVMKGMGVL